MQQKTFTITPFPVELTIKLLDPEEFIEATIDDPRTLDGMTKHEEENHIEILLHESLLHDELELITLHELIHAKQYLEIDVGTRLDMETEAYLIHWMFDIVWKEWLEPISLKNDEHVIPKKANKNNKQKVNNK